MKPAIFATVATMLVIAVVAAATQTSTWLSLGPGSALGVLSTTMRVTTATNDLVQVGSGSTAGWLALTVNGGVWRTTANPTDFTKQPSWSQVLDAGAMSRGYTSTTNSNRPRADDN